MRRRRALHLLAAAVPPLAGCTGLSDGGANSTHDATPTGTVTPTPDGGYELGETAAVDGVGDVTVESTTLQRSIIDHHTWRELREPEDGQVLVLRVEGDIDEDSPATFAPRFDGEVVDDPVVLPLHGSSDYAAVSVPLRSVERAAIVLQAGDEPAWELPGSVRERLATAPEFHLHDAVLRTEAGTTVLDLTVENRGTRGGTFRGIVVSAQAADADAAVRFDVPTGETVTETVRDSIVENWDADENFEHDVTPDTRRFVVEYA